jgi:hypothetical protein
MVDLGAIACALPNVDQGIACVGTALESRTYLLGKKSFLFVSRKDVRLKLSASAAKAKKLGLAVGANGWVKLALDALPPARVLERWIAESYALAGGATAAGTAKRAARQRGGSKKIRRA